MLTLASVAATAQGSVRFQVLQFCRTSCSSLHPTSFRHCIHRWYDPDSAMHPFSVSRAQTEKQGALSTPPEYWKALVSPGPTHLSCYLQLTTPSPLVKGLDRTALQRLKASSTKSSRAASLRKPGKGNCGEPHPKPSSLRWPLGFWMDVQAHSPCP